MKKSSTWYLVLNLLVMMGSLIAVALLLDLSFWTAFLFYLAIGFLDKGFSNVVESLIDAFKNSGQNEKK